MTEHTVQRGCTCENWANSLSASMGMWPRSSWQQSLSKTIESMSGGKKQPNTQINNHKKPQMTHGSGECMGAEEWRRYWVHWNTLKAKLLRKSLADSRPATGRSWKPVLSGMSRNTLTDLKGRRSNVYSSVALIVVTFQTKTTCNGRTGEESSNRLCLLNSILHGSFKIKARGRRK